MASPIEYELSIDTAVQLFAQLKNYHLKIEQPKNCQVTIHTLESLQPKSFLQLFSSLPSLSDECGKIGLLHISASDLSDADLFTIVF